MKNKVIKIEKKLKTSISLKKLLFKVFDDPRIEYIAKVSIIDKILDKTLFWAVPNFVRPNHITVFRFITIPFLIYLLSINDFKTAFILFMISAFSDMFDGSLARVRKQITDWGIVFDPFADKLLIGSIGGILIYRFLDPIIAIIIISLEIILIVSAYYRFKGKIVPAKTPGKIKMVFQCLGVAFILLFLLTGNTIFLIFANYILYLAIFFALLSIFVYRSI